MSRHHSAQSFRVQDLVKQVLDTAPEYWEGTFDIIEQDDGAILDLLEDRVFDSIHDWAVFNVQMEQEEDDERNYGYRYSDDD